MSDHEGLAMELYEWKKLALAQQRILVAYRIHGQPPFNALDDASAAKAALRELGAM